MVVGLLWMAGILIAMGWFAIGWIARGQENRKYAESRLKYLADQAIDDQWEFLESRARWEAERVRRQPPMVLNVYLAAGDIPAPRPPVIDGEVIPALPPQQPRAIEPRLGQPICPDCYDYPGHIAFNWHAPELWRR